MKSVKYLVVLAIALCAIPSVSKAQTVQAVGGGSSAIFLEMGQGAATAAATSTPCAWTTSTGGTNVVARDNRTSTPTDEAGNIWVTWSAGSTGTCTAPSGTGINIYSDMKLDSVVGDKCYFEVDSSLTAGCVQVLTVTTPAAGSNLLPGITDTPLPEVIRAAVNGKHFTFAATDIRPEDAKFASNRLFQPCGAPMYRQPFDLGYRLTYGLGYATGTTGVGLKINSAFSAGAFNVLDFALAGTDPISGNTVPNFAVTPIGAQPIVVAVAPVTDTAGIAGASDINGFTLALFYEGVLGRATDLAGVTNANAVVTLVREPLSGTYNTFEYSVPNSSQFHTSQDDNFCNGSAVFSQTMNAPSANSAVVGAARKRVIGTGEMINTLNGTSGTIDMLGYAFWSDANFHNKTNIKYLTVNGVDPLLDSYGSSGGVAYTPGLLPQATPAAGTPPLTAVSFKNLAAGDYPIWSAVRVVSLPSDAGVANLVTASHTVDATQHDYIPLSSLKVWHSHFPLYGVTGANANGSSINTANDLCNGGSAEAGGDAGGANVLESGNKDFCADYGNSSGLINKTN
jgi:hypothetical protein